MALVCFHSYEIRTRLKYGEEVGIFNYFRLVLLWIINIWFIIGLIALIINDCNVSVVMNGLLSIVLGFSWFYNIYLSKCGVTKHGSKNQSIIYG